MPSEIEGILYGKTADFSGVVLRGGKDLVRFDSAGVCCWKLLGFGVFEPWLIGLLWLVVAGLKYVVILAWRESFGGDSLFLVCIRPIRFGFSANISNKSSMVRYGFWCFGVGFGGVGGQIFGAVSVHLGIGFAAGIGRRDGFGATTGREAISAQDIGFFGVAIGVIGGVSWSEVFGVVFDEATGGVCNDVVSLRGGGVAGGVGIAATAFDISIDAADDCFGVEGGVGIAVDTAALLGALILAFDARRSLMVTTQGHVGEYSQCFR